MDGGEGSFHPQRSTMPTEESHPSSSTIFPESRLAHKLLDGLEGLEIGPAAHNPFGLNTRNVGLAADRDPFDYEFFKQSQLEMCGSFAAIDISADAADIPVPDDSTDFVLHSHVWEHLPNPLIALDEWVRDHPIWRLSLCHRAQARCGGLGQRSPGDLPAIARPTL